jgi:acetylornithine deacetylase
MRSGRIRSTPHRCAGIEYEGRFQLRVVRKGTGTAPPLLFNAHVDVVPPSPGMSSPFAPRWSSDTVYARGACDDKGPVASLYALMATLQEDGCETPGDVILHLVVEEEVGGNGTLAMVRSGERPPGGVVVLEPTNRRFLVSTRGAVWFQLSIVGKAGHSGQAQHTTSALELALRAIDALRDYQARLLADSRGFPFFDDFENPMPLTIGILNAGNWPAAAPEHARLEGVLGFLPNRNREQVCGEIRESLIAAGLTQDSFELRFTYRHDCSTIDPDHVLVRSLMRSSVEAKARPHRLDAFTASCDAWFYSEVLGVPTVVYGPGDIRYAHSKDEQIDLSEVLECAAILTRLAVNGVR